MYDLGEPCCFGCGWYSERWDKGSARINWQRATLERAHIVPSSLGGSDGVDNLILLCGPCHKESPDWSDPGEMARWLAARTPRRSKEFEEMEAWIAAAGEVPEFSQMLAASAGDPDSADRIVAMLWDAARRAGLHWGVGLSQGTRVAIIRSAVAGVGAPQGDS
ncbi:HNH endonuclease [Streptomyces sp. B1I3]|uniref:HNH endonuclease n=1 Tax=Streptomyces sp. B1I3 TaxID=3042264 RepID=UPI00358F977D